MDSDEYEDHGIVYDPTPQRSAPYIGPWWKHPYLRSHKRLTLGVLGLHLLTIALVIVGVAMLGTGDGGRAAVFIVLAVLTAIPAIYQTLKIYRKMKRNTNYVANEYEDDEDDIN